MPRHALNSVAFMLALSSLSLLPSLLVGNRAVFADAAFAALPFSAPPPISVPTTTGTPILNAFVGIHRPSGPFRRRAASEKGATGAASASKRDNSDSARDYDFSTATAATETKTRSGTDGATSTTTTRRSAIGRTVRTLLATTAAAMTSTAPDLGLTAPAMAAEAESAGGDSASSLPPVTQKVFFDVRISRSDGTFYVRDAPADGTPDEDPFYGRIVIGLFGSVRPVHASKFLSYVDIPLYDVDDPLPSFSRSKFPTMDASTGLLAGGTIPGLAMSTLGGGTALKYGTRVLAAPLWIEETAKLDEKERQQLRQLTHATKGLLTHRNLDPTPSFGITTRNGDGYAASALDGTHTIFGCVLSSDGFLDKIVDLPALTADGRVTATIAVSEQAREGATEVLASSVFSAQRRIFRDAAKTFGDTRLETVYDGKLLRRVEVTKVGVL